MVYYLFSHSTVRRCFVSLFGCLIFDLPQAARAAADCHSAKFVPMVR